MTRFASTLPSIVVAVLLTAGCGSSRRIQTVTLSPTSADARNFPNGTVPFAATGTFNQPPSPSPLTSQQVAWCIGNASGVCDPAMPPYPAVDANGVAQCGTFAGTVTVLAGTPRQGMADAPSFTVFGSAQLTCP